MWAKKLGLVSVEPTLLNELFHLMMLTKVDYTIFFRQLSHIPEDFSDLKKSFYLPSSEQLNQKWQAWLTRWRECILKRGDLQDISDTMKRVNPSVTWREWLIAPAYREAEHGDYNLIHELQDVFSDPYTQLPDHLASKYDQLRPKEFFNSGGVSHYSCSS